MTEQRTTWWRVARWGNTPEPVTVVRETACTLHVLETSPDDTTAARPAYKVSEFATYFPSYTLARDAIIDRARNGLRLEHTRMAGARSRFEQAVALPLEPPNTRDTP